MTVEIVENQMARGTALTEENKEFLREIIKHYEGFASVTADVADSRAIRAEGYSRVGLMRYRLGELKEEEAAYAAARPREATGRRLPRPSRVPSGAGQDPEQPRSSAA